MKYGTIIVFAVALAGCASLGPQTDASSSAAVSVAAPATQIGDLVGGYDNHEQVWQAQQAKAALVPPHIHHRIEAVGGGEGMLLWHERLERAQQPMQASWRYQVRTLVDGRVMLTPQRPLPASAKGATPQWATLQPCAMEGHWQNGHLLANTNIEACSALLPGLGAAAALLPLRVDFDGDMLEVATFADRAQGDEALEHARRVRWFSGWVAINGAGPDATGGSKDWHTHRDLRLHDEGGRTPVLWRDGKPSGYVLELARLTYRESKTPVLKLSLIQASSGETLSYAWANPGATRLGFNLGWIQVGLEQVADAAP